MPVLPNLTLLPTGMVAVECAGGAYVDHCDFVIPGVPDGALSGLRFSVKDIFDVKGVATGFGNPEWLTTHAELAEEHAPSVEALLCAGATADGKTHMDELAYSLNGENVHYGTPINPAAPDRVPEVEPAFGPGIRERFQGGHCGSYESKMAKEITADEVVSAAAARDEIVKHLDTLLCGGVLMAFGRRMAEWTSWVLGRWHRPSIQLVGTDAFALADPAVSKAIYAALSGQDSSRFQAVCEAIGGEPTEVTVAPPDGSVAGG
eukprot:gene1089-1643_t